VQVKTDQPVAYPLLLVATAFLGAGQLDPQQARSPGRPCRLGRRRRLRELGGQADPGRGRVGTGRPRRAGRRGVRLGRRADSRPPVDGQHLAGRVPGQRHRRGRLPGHLTGRRLPRQRLRPVRVPGDPRHRVVVAHNRSICAPGPRPGRSLIRQTLRRPQVL
jgi:hypothetical protein